MGKLLKLTNEESLELFERIMLCIKKQKRGFFYLKKLKEVHGYCEWEDGVILDYRKDFIATIIHECIHLLEPEWSEKKVLYAESRVINTVSDIDIVRLLALIVKKL